MSGSWKLTAVLVAFLAAMAAPVLAAEQVDPPANEPPKQKLKLAGGDSAKEKPAAGEEDRFTVPDGTPKELVAYITKLISSDPPRDLETLTKLRKAILRAAEKILAAKPNNEEMEFAVQAKMNMLEKPEQLSAFIDELKKGNHEKLARMVRGFMLQVELRKIMMSGSKDSKKTIDEVVKFFEEGTPQVADITLAYTAGLMSEMGGDRDVSVQTYERLAKVFAASKDAKLGEFAKVLQGVVRRLNLVGQEFKLEGKTPDGKAFDWAKYQGKVVLVNFWASEYPACVRDIPNLKGLYELYHDKGFDIVGISLDATAEDAGHDKIYVIPANGGTPALLSEVKEGTFSGLAAPDAAPGLFALWGSMIHPEDVAAIDLKARTHRLLTHFNDDRIANIDWQPMREFWFTAKNGKRIQSLIVLPPGFDPKQKYPLVVFPHGGPHNMVKDQFFVRWNYHLLTTPGLRAANDQLHRLHGIRREASQPPSTKDMSAHAGRGSRAGRRRGDRAPSPSSTARARAAIGASYGGYLMAWFEGQHQALQMPGEPCGAHRQLVILGRHRRFVSTGRSRNGGPVWELSERSGADQSPAAYAANFTTPMLVTHGEQDFRVPINQAFEMYKLLQRKPGAEPPGDIPRRQPLGAERRRRAPAHEGSYRLAEALPVTGS